MKPRNLLCASLAFAMLSCGPLLRAEDPSILPPGYTETVQAAGAPIPQAPGARTHRDLGRQRLDWEKRHLLPPLQAAVKGQPWEAAALEFAEDSCAIWADIDEEKSADAWAQMAIRADNLLKSGCDELTVRYLATRDRFMAKGDKKSAETEYRQILDQLRKDPRYPKALAWQVAMNLRSVLPAGPRALDAVIIGLERQSYEEGSYVGADDVLFVDQIINATDLLSQNSDAMEKLLNSLPKLPEWARETILGKVEIDRAWHARGSGFADTVTEEGWKGFGGSLNKARAHLEAAWTLRPDQPYAAGEMITVAMGSESGNGESLRLWFDRAVTARFDFRKAYRAYTWAIRPRWGGSHEAMLAFGRACAATKRYETMVPHHLIRVVDDIGKELSTRREVYEKPEIGADVVAVDKGYAADPSQAGVKSMRLSNLLFDAWLCGKWDDARAALDQLPGQKMDPAVRGRMVEFAAARNNIIGEILLNTGPAKADYFQARDLEKHGFYDEAAPHFAAALKACGNQPALRELVTSYTKINEIRIELDKGQWMDIMPKAADHSDWDLSRQTKIAEDGVLEITGTGETTLSRWRRPLGENYEVRATFEFLSPPEKKHLFGIALGETGSNPPQSLICEFYSDPKTKGKVYVLRGFIDAKNPIFDAELAMTNHVRIQCWQGRLNLYLNGQRVFENFQSADGTPSDHNGEIGFGGFKLPAEASFRLSKIAVRVLKSEPAPPAGGEDE